MKYNKLLSSTEKFESLARSVDENENKFSEAKEHILKILKSMNVSIELIKQLAPLFEDEAFLVAFDDKLVTNLANKLESFPEHLSKMMTIVGEFSKKLNQYYPESVED